jgi:Fe-S oxidoreductase
MRKQRQNEAAAGELVRQVSRECINCGKCGRDCGYLRRFGLPGTQAAAFLEGGLDDDQPFLCSLCGLCTAVCPVDIDPAAMFMALRREAVERGKGRFREHRVLTAYERRGNSPLFSWYGLPRDCATVFFPGCALPGTRPGRVLDVYTRLRGEIPQLGLVLDCCTKPSHDLGRRDHFRRMFGALITAMKNQGVTEVLTACPNCFRMFDGYGGSLRVHTVYELLARAAPSPAAALQGTVTVHDPCGARQETTVHAAVRRLVTAAGLDIREMRHRTTRTFCCGEGGAVGYLDAALANRWGELRCQEASSERIITYCAGCTGYLGRLAPTSHVLDLLFAPEATMAGREKPARSPWTYINRLLLKRRLRGIVQPESEGRRTREGAIAFRPSPGRH